MTNPMTNSEVLRKEINGLQQEADRAVAEGRIADSYRAQARRYALRAKLYDLQWGEYPANVVDREVMSR